MLEREIPAWGMHIAPPGTWELVRRHGFWPTAALVEEATVGGRRLLPLVAEELVTSRRAHVVCLDHPRIRTVRLNHNGPIQPQRLQECLALAGLGPSDAPAYFRALAERVFFWPSDRLRQTWRDKSGPSTFEGVFLKSYERVERIWVDLRALHAKAPTMMGFSQYNSGSTPRFSGSLTPRSPTMWVDVRNWDLPAGRIHEIAWHGTIHDVSALVKWVEEGARGAYLKLWSPPHRAGTPT